MTRSTAHRPVHVSLSTGANPPMAPATIALSTMMTPATMETRAPEEAPARAACAPTAPGRRARHPIAATATASATHRTASARATPICARSHVARCTLAPPATPPIERRTATISAGSASAKGNWAKSAGSACAAVRTVRALAARARCPASPEPAWTSRKASMFATSVFRATTASGPAQARCRAEITSASMRDRGRSAPQPAAWTRRIASVRRSARAMAPSARRACPWIAFRSPAIPWTAPAKPRARRWTIARRASLAGKESACRLPR